jgi:ketosteroid isomerase-like protein
MNKELAISLFVIIAISTVVALGQNTNSSQTVRPRTTATNANQSSTEAQKSTDLQQPTTTQPVARTVPPQPKVSGTEVSGSASVVAAFNALLNGIRRADVKAVTNVYWNSPRLILFNNNGTVTKGWEQMRKNRESSYPDLKDVKLVVRDVSIMMLGRDGAVVSCLWTQSQTFKDTPETASGRMTLVFKRIGKDWKAVQLHTSPDKPEPSRVLPSEQQTSTASPSPTP